MVVAGAAYPIGAAAQLGAANPNSVAANAVAAAAAGSPPTGRALIRAVEDWFYLEDELTDTVTAFCDTHCQKFGDAKQGIDYDQTAAASLASIGSGEGRSLEHTALHAEFCALFESKLERFVEDSLGSTVANLFQALRVESDAIAAQGRPASVGFAAVIMCVVEYFEFDRMMRAAKAGMPPCFVPPLEDF